MIILASNLMGCDGCGTLAYHPLLYLPDGWAEHVPLGRDALGNPIGQRLFLCLLCQPKVLPAAVSV